MQTCGVCVVNSTDVWCSICPVDVCKTCSRTVEISIALPPRPKYNVVVCEICETQLKTQAASSCLSQPCCYFEIRSNPKYKLCYDCSFTYNDKIQIYILSARYCYTCDTVVGKCEYYHDKRKCEGCINRLRTKTRETLAHYKVKPIIEEFLHVKDVVEIIFAYCGEPRRYFKTEM